MIYDLAIYFLHAMYSKSPHVGLLSTWIVLILTPHNALTWYIPWNLIALNNQFITVIMYYCTEISIL